jgi:hypothetical protein
MYVNFDNPNFELSHLEEMPVHIYCSSVASEGTE